jgi:Fe/S biogenesis protein NfuA
MTTSASTCSSHASPVTLTPKAAFHVREIAHSMGKQGALVRIQAHPEAPEEQRYELEFVERDSLRALDRVHVTEGLQIVLDDATAAYMHGTVMDFVQGMWEAGFRFENPNLTKWGANSMAQAVQSVLEAKVLPVLKSHGGSVRLLDVVGGVAKVQFSGGCQGCGLAPVTLNGSVRGVLLAEVAGLIDVVDATDHSDDSAAYFRGASPNTTEHSPQVPG